jgi:hypothetical protein
LYWLLPSSPAIDAGTATPAVGYNRYDLTGADRIHCAAVDLGTIEFRP